MTCSRCLDTGTVCEQHPERPWPHWIREGDRHLADCAGPGMPCDCGAFKVARTAVEIIASVYDN